MVWILLTAGLGIFFGTVAIFTAFPAVYMLKRAEDAGVWIPDGERRTGRVWYVLGAIGNPIYNATVGWYRFKERPREWAYSERIQRYIDEGTGWRYEKALPHARFLNFVDPSPHIKGVPE